MDYNFYISMAGYQPEVYVHLPVTNEVAVPVDQFGDYAIGNDHIKSDTPFLELEATPVSGSDISEVIEKALAQLPKGKLAVLMHWISGQPPTGCTVVYLEPGTYKLQDEGMILPKLPQEYFDLVQEEIRQVREGTFPEEAQEGDEALAEFEF